ncbi:hypothetical protein ES706_00772 [subsurface metagenome]
MKNVASEGAPRCTFAAIESKQYCYWNSVWNLTSTKEVTIKSTSEITKRFHK